VITCPFCGENVSESAALCPVCNVQLPEAHLIPFYQLEIASDRSLAQPSKRARLNNLAIKRYKVNLEIVENAKAAAIQEAAQAKFELEQARKIATAKAEAARIKRAEEMIIIKKRTKKIAIIISPLLFAGMIFGGNAFYRDWSSRKLIEADCLIVQEDLGSLNTVLYTVETHDGMRFVNRPNMSEFLKTVNSDISTIGELQSPQVKKLVGDISVLSNNLQKYMETGLTHSKWVNTMNAFSRVLDSNLEISDSNLPYTDRKRLSDFCSGVEINASQIAKLAKTFVTK
jgi:hypothetical protein